MTYDPKCYELAQHFLPDVGPSNVEALAEVIQEAIEEFLNQD